MFEFFSTKAKKLKVAVDTVNGIFDIQMLSAKDLVENDVFIERLNSHYSRGYIYIFCLVFGRSSGVVEDSPESIRKMQMPVHCHIFGDVQAEIILKQSERDLLKHPIFEKGSSRAFEDILYYFDPNGKPIVGLSSFLKDGEEIYESDRKAHKVKKNSIDNLSLNRNVLSKLVKIFPPHFDQLSNESDEMINNAFTLSNVVYENLEEQLQDSGSSTQPLLLKLEKNVYNKRLENLYSRGYILGLCSIVGHPKDNEYLCLDKKPDKIEEMNKLFIFMILIIQFIIFGQKGFSILAKSQLDSDIGKPMFDKGVKDSLQDMKESAESGFTKNPKRLFNYLMKKN